MIDDSETSIVEVIIEYRSRPNESLRPAVCVAQPSSLFRSNGNAALHIGMVAEIIFN
jgi:hypothetical protein